MISERESLLLARYRMADRLVARLGRLAVKRFRQHQQKKVTSRQWGKAEIDFLKARRALWAVEKALTKFWFGEGRNDI